VKQTTVKTVLTQYSILYSIYIVWCIGPYGIRSCKAEVRKFTKTVRQTQNLIQKQSVHYAALV